MATAAARHARSSTPADDLVHNLPALAEILEVCAALGVSRRTVYNWMSAGKIEWVTLPSGNRRVVTASLLRVGGGGQTGTNNGHR